MLKIQQTWTNIPLTSNIFYLMSTCSEAIHTPEGKPPTGSHFSLRLWPHRNGHQPRLASEHRWTGPRPGRHVLSVPCHPRLPNIIKYRRAIGGLTPWSQLELIVKSELSDCWPKLTPASNMDIIMLTIRFLKFHDEIKHVIPRTENLTFFHSLKWIIWPIS